MGVDRNHAPLHSVRARRELRQRHPEQPGIGAVDVRIALVDLFAIAIEHVDLAECRLESFREPQLEPRRRGVNGAAGSRRHPVELSMRAGRKDRQCGQGGHQESRQRSLHRNLPGCIDPTPSHGASPCSFAPDPHAQAAGRLDAIPGGGAAPERAAEGPRTC